MTRIRHGLIIVVLIAVALSLSCTLPTLMLGTPKVSLYVLDGDVQLSAPGATEWKPGTSCFALDQGYSVRTANSGQALVSLAGGSKLFMDPASQISLQTVSSVGKGAEVPVYNLKLDDGAVYLDTTQQNNGVFLVQTAGTIVAARGGALWLQRSSNSSTLTLDLFEGEAVLAQLAEGDGVGIRVLEAAPGSSLSLPEAQTSSKGYEEMMQALTVILASESNPFAALSSAGSIQSALAQIASKASLDPVIGTQLLALGITLTNSTQLLTTDNLELLSLKQTDSSNWDALLQNSSIKTNGTVQPISSASAKPLIQDIETDLSQTAGPSGTSESIAGPSEGTDADLQQTTVERPSCGRDAAKPKSRQVGTKADLKGQGAETAKDAKEKTSSNQGIGAEKSSANKDKNASVTVLHVPQRSPNADARLKEIKETTKSIARGPENKSDAAKGADKSDEKANGQKKDDKDKSAEQASKGQETALDNADKKDKDQADQSDKQKDNQAKDNQGKQDDKKDQAQGGSQADGSDKDKGSAGKSEASGQDKDKPNNSPEDKANSKGGSEDKDAKNAGDDKPSSGNDKSQADSKQNGSSQQTPSADKQDAGVADGANGKGSDKSDEKNNKNGGDNKPDSASGGKSSDNKSQNGKSSSGAETPSPTPTPDPTATPLPTATPVSPSGQGGNDKPGNGNQDKGPQDKDDKTPKKDSQSPSPVPAPTPTPVPQPTATPLPPTPTPVPPTATPLPPTPTPVPPTATPPPPPTPTPVPQGQGQGNQGGGGNDKDQKDNGKKK